MTDLMIFLTSEEIMMVYVIVGLGCLLSLFVYIANKTYYSRKQKSNTQELNRLVEQIKEKSAVDEILEEKPPVASPATIEVEIEKKKEEPFVLPEVKEAPVEIKVETAPKTVEKIEYENIEPDKTEAQLELEKITEELQKAKDSVENIDLTEFEAQQEENAIISLEELFAKGTSLYEQNEITQYEDEGNEPISLQDLEEWMNKNATPSTVQIAEQPASEEKEVKTSSPVVETTEPKKDSAYQGAHAFKSSPIISPIFGIEKQTQPTQTELALENTANYEKLDEEIRKTNEFVMTLKELQKKLD